MDGPPWAWGRAASEPPSCSRSGPGGRNTPSENRRWARPPAGRSSSPGATLSPDVNVRGGSGSSPPSVRDWDAAGKDRSGLGCPASSSTWGLPGLGASRASTAGTPGLGDGWQEPSSGGPAAGEPKVSGGRKGGPGAAVLWASAHWGWRGEPASRESRQGDLGPEPKASAGRPGLGVPPFSKVGPGPGGTRGWRTCKRKSGPVTARPAQGGPCPPPRDPRSAASCPTLSPRGKPGFRETAPQDNHQRLWNDLQHWRLRGLQTPPTWPSPHKMHSTLFPWDHSDHAHRTPKPKAPLRSS